MSQVIVTTSWDDGHRCDVRLATLLKKYGVAATFYISPEDREFAAKDRLSKKEIRALAQNFEIGAHTITHPHLVQLRDAEAKREITRSKESLEKIIGKPVTSFCYPYGSYNERTKEIVASSGFSYARTVQRFATRSSDRFAARTSVDTFDHPRAGLTKVLRLCGRRPWRALKLWRWDNLAKEMFARARDQGEVFHLWGHSHEIEAHGDWQRLERLLAWLAAQPNVKFVPNCEVPIAKPKVLLTSPYFKPHTGGLEEYVYRIASGLQRDYGWDVVVVASEKNKTMQVTEYDGIKVYRLPRRVAISNTPLSFKWRRQLRQIIAAEQPDIVNAHAPVPGMLDATRAAARRTPLVVTYHMGSMKKGRRGVDLLISWYEHTLLKWSLYRAQRIICSSPFVQQGYLGHYFHKTEVITPGVDVKTFKPSTIAAAPHHLLHVGGLKAGESHKGLARTLKAVVRLAENYPDVHLTVAGEGSRLLRYQQLANSLGIAKRVTFAGRLDARQMAQAYRDSRVLVSPSSKESFGMVLAEAMACGLPVVAGNVGGVPQLVRDGRTGYVIDPLSVDELVSRTAELFDDSALAARMGRAGHSIAKSSYRWGCKVEATHLLFAREAGLLPKTRKPKLLLATPYYSPKVGGLENYAHQIARQLLRHGWEVVAVTSSHSGRKFGTDIVDGVRVYRLPALLQFSNTPLGLLWGLRVWHIVNREKPDIINGHTPVPGMADAAAFASGRKPFVLTYHAATLYKKGNLPFNAIIFGYRLIEKIMLARARQIVTVTPYHQDRMPRRASAKFYRIENAIPAADLMRQPAAKQPRRLVFIGNLVKAHAWKGLEEILQAVAIHNKTAGKPAHLDVIGGGDYSARYESLVQKLGIQEAVTFHGQQTGDAKNKLLARAEAFIGYPTSAQDAFPTVLLEAWAHWTPVIAANIGALPHIIRDGEDGVLVTPHNPAALATTIGMVLENAGLRRSLAQNGHARASSLTWDNQGVRTDELFRGLML